MVTITQALPENSRLLADLLRELDLSEGYPGKGFTAEAVLRDAFCVNPAFYAFFAWQDEYAIGYLLWYPAYDTDLMGRKMWISDIYLRPEARGLGAGKALMRAAARHAQTQGYVSIELPVRHDNHSAQNFYKKLGGKNKNSILMRWSHDTLKDLMAEE